MAVLSLNARPAASQRVTMRVGYRLTFIGDRVAVDARVVDNSGRPLASAPLAFHIGDPAIAAVSTRGEVVAKKPGKTLVWAVSGRDSASSLILVEPWASKFAFTPGVIRLDAIGAKQPLKVVASDAAGVPVAGSTNKTSSCRSVNDRVATLTALGDVVAVANGATFVRCADRGIADSVKVDVQQRAVTASILNKSALSRKAFGDTFSVRISTKDRQGKDVLDARPTWASLNPGAVSVDPLTGKARAVNAGDAKIIVQIGDIADSTTISVTGGPAFAPVVVSTAVADSASAASKASVSAQDIFMSELDTAMVSVVVTDSTGAAMQNPKFKIRVGDNSIVKVVDSLRVVALKPGQSKLIVEYGSRVDSMKTVYVRPKTKAGAADSAAGTATGPLFVRPGATFRDSIPRYAAVRDTVVTVIHTDPRTAAGRKNLLFSANFVGAVAEHLSHPSTNVTEDRTGVLTGGAGVLSLFQILELSGTLRRGNLATTTAVGEDLALIEGEGSIGLFPFKELGIRAGYMLRSEKTKLATQTWSVPKVSLVTRFRLIGDLFSTYAAFSILPKAKYTGAPNETGGVFSRAGEAGLEFRKEIGKSAFTGGLTYYAEQFNFDNSPRVEEFSAIRFRLGLQRGW